MPRHFPAPVAQLHTETAERLAHLVSLSGGFITAEERQVARVALEAAADSLVRYARARGGVSPAKSAAGLIREHVSRETAYDGQPLRAVLGAAVRAALPRVASALPPAERAADEAEVADFIGVTLAELRTLLRTPHGRRGLWYPLHVGDGCFRWPRPFLLDPAVQAARCAGGEPPHPCPLPPGYELDGDAGT